MGHFRKVTLAFLLAYFAYLLARPVPKFRALVISSNALKLVLVYGRFSESTFHLDNGHVLAEVGTPW